MSSGYDCAFRLVIVGDSGVGKSCLFDAFCHKNFREEAKHTTGIDYINKTLALDGNRIRLQIWDTAGQESFRAMTSSCFIGADGIIIVYDVTNMESFNNVRMWLDENDVPESVPKLLVGNKCDLPWAVNPAMAHMLADSLGIPFVETSAKDSTNVEEAFDQMTREVMRRMSLPLPPAGRAGGVRLPEVGQQIPHRKVRRCELQ